MSSVNLISDDHGRLILSESILEVSTDRWPNFEECRSVSIFTCGHNENLNKKNWNHLKAYQGSVKELPIMFSRRQYRIIQRWIINLGESCNGFRGFQIWIGHLFRYLAIETFHCGGCWNWRKNFLSHYYRNIISQGYNYNG